ncbi:unnamed protein product [Medioppia subpectinata]|uniref:NR LBD domain-containing protein n=1 Tax=Medioppia subpectinata TaxID=1979941 RepID=A0A7R9PTH2_9ACAR|nr:unnamed protein product [Medioppia subpectinata]CAG2100130.1 unnamed protein product [Medioppia subpectinata]
MALQLVSTQPSTQSLSANSHYLNKHESNCLLELLGAISHLTTPPIPSSNAVNGFFRSPEELMNYSVEVFDSYLSDFVDSIKKISAFQHICLNDQIALVKYGCLEVKMIRIGVSFDIKNKCWSFQTDNNDTIKLSLDLFKGFKTNTYSVLKKYLLRVVNELDHDHLILNLLVPILFFNPERPNIIHKEVVVLQQQLYVYLLQRYLRLKYGSESDVRNKFLRILNLMQDVQALDKLHKQNMITTVSPNNFGPLLKEILDIQTDLCIDN